MKRIFALFLTIWSLLYTNQVFAKDTVIKAKMYLYDGAVAPNGDISFNFILENGDVFKGVLAYVIANSSSSTELETWYWDNYDPMDFVFVKVVYYNKEDKVYTVTVNSSRELNIKNDLGANLIKDQVAQPDEFCYSEEYDHGKDLCETYLQLNNKE